MTLFYRGISLCVASLLAACNSLPTQPEPQAIPPSLATLCPPPRPPSDGTGETMLKWGIQQIELYAECASRHRRLVEAWPK
jgi:hypothetical protein